MSTCKSCGAEIIWTRSPKGARMPLDSAPTPTGKWAIRGEGEEAEAVFATPGDPSHACHFETCPNADTHRKPAAPGSKAAAPASSGAAVTELVAIRKLLERILVAVTPKMAAPKPDAAPAPPAGPNPGFTEEIPF